MTNAEKQKKIQKSPRFPSIDLDFAIEVVREARKFGKRTTDAYLAGKGKPSGGGFSRKKASLGYYGLISGRTPNLEITDLSDSIIYALNEKERAEAIKKAFLSYETFKKIYDTWEKNTPYEVQTLSNFAVRNFGVQESAKNEFINTFIKSGLYAGIIKYNGDDKSQIILIDDTQSATSYNEEAAEPQSPTSSVSTTEELASESIQMELQVVELSLENGKAKIIVPKVLTDLDAKKLKAQINILANIFE